MSYKVLTGSATAEFTVSNPCLGVAIIANTQFGDETLGWDYKPNIGKQLLGTKPRKLTMFQELDSNLNQEGNANRQAALSDVIISFSPFGQLSLDGENPVNIQLASLDPAKVYTVFLVEHPEKSTTLNIFENALLPAGKSSHVIMNKGYSKLVLPDTDSITEVLVTYKGVDGSQVVNMPIELIRLMSVRTSDVVVRTSKTQAIFGYDAHHILDMGSVQEVEIRTDESLQQLFFVKYQGIGGAQ